MFGFLAEIVAVVTSVLGCATVAVSLVSPCLREPITEGYNYFRKRKERLDTLTTKMAALEQQRAQVDLQSKEKVLSKSLLVFEWLDKADEFIKQVADLKFKDKIGEINCCGLPNYIEQYKAGKQIEQRIVEFEALEKEGQKFIDVQESDVVGQMKEAKEPVGEAKSKVEEIMKYVTEKEGCTILVYGMAGSGKTRVVSRVNDLILSAYNGGHEYFDKVIWVTAVNKGSISVDNLQKKIAEKLQIDLKNATENTAAILEGALKSKRFLIILDDMWRNLSLEAIGIPRPTTENGRKVIIVSGSAPGLSNIKFDKKVETEPLLYEEAKKLFEDEACMDVSILKEDSTRGTIKEMIEECEGLPLAIVSLAETLKGLKKNGLDDDAAWKEALEEIPSHLESRNEKAFNRLKDSFDMLNEEVQQCFLYCALYPSQHKMKKKKLVEYWFWQGFLEGTERSIEGRTRAREILDELIGTYLLKEVDKEYIKMSNIVRQMAVHLTQKSPGKFLIKADKKLFKWNLHEEDLSEVKRASLMSNQIQSLMEEPKFLKLSTLLLQHNNISRLSDNFFRSMPNIKVLDLSHTMIPSLQKSAFSNLRKLRALLLRDCPKLEYLPSLANSKELLVLDLYNTPTKQLPDGMNELKKLIRLNLSHTKVGEFEAELVTALASLEELFIITNDVSAGSLWGSEKGATSIEKLGV